jgi:hypothetical protein
MNTTSSTFTPEHLVRWKWPPHYVGARWDGYYRAPEERNRESELLTQSNWTIQLRELEKHKADVPDDDIVSPLVVRESHWAVGWIEWVAIHESNVEALKVADAFAARLESYPILDEGHYSDLEYSDYWKEWEGPLVRREFAKGLANIFALSDRATDLIADANADLAMEVFESLVPCGEYFTPGGGGVHVSIDIALQHAEQVESIDRKWMADALRRFRRSDRRPE